MLSDFGETHESDMLIYLQGSQACRLVYKCATLSDILIYLQGSQALESAISFVKQSDILIYLQGSQADKAAACYRRMSDILIYLQGSQAETPIVITLRGLTYLFTYKVLKPAAVNMLVIPV